MRQISGPERFALEKLGGMPRELIDNIETSQLELLLGHDMLSQLLEPKEHDAIHAASLMPEVRSKAPEMADTAESGECLFNMLCFVFIKAKGRDAFELLKRTKYPGLV